MSNATHKPTKRHFAFLGATGNTGRLILSNLLTATNPEDKFSIYVRSRTKLENLIPSISLDKRVVIFEGSIKDENLIKDCLSGAQTIFCTLGENENIPNITVLQDSAQAILTALSSLRLEARTPSEWKAPRLLFLSSATWNPRFAADRPALIHWMISNAFARPYSDLVKAQETLKKNPDLVDLLLVQPNALVKEPATGCVISTEFAYTAVSYEDLAEGFVRLATMPQYSNIAAVGVSSARAKNPVLYVPFVFGKVIRGLLFQFVPGYWQLEYAITRRLDNLKGKKKA